MSSKQDSLPHRKLGKTGRQVSEIGFGAWAIGADWGEVTEQDAKFALHAGLDAGMTCIDTADIYGAGRSERIIGEVLADRAEQQRPFVATKIGRGEGFQATTAAVEQAIAGSLARLKCDCLDLVQLHCLPFPLLQESDLLSILDNCKQKGMIASWGVSVEQLAHGAWLIEQSNVEVLQIIFNAMRQNAAWELLPQAAEAGVGIFARIPLASGLLSGKYSAEHQFDIKDHRNYNANGEAFYVGETFAGLPFAKGTQLASEFAELVAGEHENALLSQQALRWVLDHDAVSCVIPGAKSPAQAEKNAAASQLEAFSEETHVRLAEWYEDEVLPEMRGEL